MARRLALVVLAAVVVMVSADPAMAVSARASTPDLPLNLSSLVSWLTGDPKPHFGHLPRQMSGTAAGHGHRVSAGATRAGRGAGHRRKPGRGELPAFRQPTAKVVKGRSGKVLTGFVARTSKRVASKSTATSDYFRNADGSFTRKLAQTPINYRDASGNWQPIDTSLRVGKGNRLEEKANALAVDFAPSAADPELVRLGLKGGRTFAYGLQGAAPVLPSYSGSTALYRGVLPQTDLELSPTAAGMKESLVLHSAAAANSWTFPLELKGITPVAAADGSIDLVNAAGKTTGRIPPAYAFDSKINPRSGERAMTHAVSYRLAGSGSHVTLVMTLDPSWLHAKERVFPVTVDPSTINEDSSVSTYAESGAPGDHSMEQLIKVGSWDSGPYSAASYLQFPDLGIDGSKVTVQTASLQLLDVWASTCTAERFDVAPVSKTWTASSVTSYPGPPYGSSIGNLTPSVPHACANTTGDMTKGDTVTVSLSVTPFNNWAAGSSSDYGLAVYASTSDSLHWKQFASANALYNEPMLTLTYYGATMLPVVTHQEPASGYSSPTLTPQLLATTAQDPSLATTPKFEFRVYDTSGNTVVDSGLVTARNATQTGSWSVPPGKLKWGHTYYWGAVSYDGTNYSAAPALQALTPTVPQPVVTSSLSQNSGNRGFDPAVGNYTTSATDANVAAAGPTLSLVRDYNSRDPRTSGAFGAAWSSVVDAKAVEQYDPSGAVQSVAVTYPDGSTVGYGKNSDGSFSPPQGRFATFTAVTGGGYALTDKNDTTYTFTQSLGSGAYGVTAITDAKGRAENFAWSSGHITTMTSATSNRALHLTWSTPSGAASAHVATVSTDPATAGNSGTALTWSYNYTGDQLTKVCSPVDTTGCTQYGYTPGSLYHNQVLDQGAASFWPLAESSGTTAASAVLPNEGVDNGTYSNVTLGQPGPLTGGTATAAGFNGTSSMVTLPDLHLGVSSSESVSMWFKTSTPGVLLSYSDQPIAATSTSGNAIPALYVGTDGKLMGTFWSTDSPAPISTPGSVADGKWHHVVLSGSPSAQTLYLDGAKVGTAAGSSSYDFNYLPGAFAHHYLGTGFLGYLWPDEPHHSTTSLTLYGTYFNGSIADAAIFNRPLVQADVTGLYNAGTHPATLLHSITRPSGNAYASVDYDPVTTTVTHVTDDQGGSWAIAAPTVTGSSQVFRSAVLGSAPANYFRLGDSAGATQATDEIHSGPATYSNVTLGSEGPFSDATGAAFDGTSSYVQLPSSDQVQTTAGSVEMWFKMPANNTAGGVLFDEEATAVGATAGARVPALYVGTDGKLHGKFWDTNGTSNGLTSTINVNDGLWHHVVLAVSSNAQTMYLDGVAQGSLSAALVATAVSYTYVGAGQAGGNWPNPPTNTAGYFPGSIAEVAFYHSQLSGDDAARHFAAGKNSVGLAPVQTVRVTDPGGKTITYQYDPWHGNRQIAKTDALGNTTTDGYDSGGFLNTVTDPNGNVTTIGHDVRGNEVSQTTCQNQATQACSTSYTSYLPDDTSAQLTPGPTNDLIAASGDGRSASASDTTYQTSYSYDSKGDQTAVTTPPVPGFAHGRTTSIAYTDGTTVAAADTGYAPAGLPYKTVSPGGATSTISYFHDGDVASVTDAGGQVTKFTYDNLGRVLTKTVVSDSYPSGLTTSYTYNGMGLVTQETDPAVTDRVTGAVHTPVTTRIYDADSQLTSQTVADTTGGDASRSTSTAYNANGLVTSTTDANNQTTTLTYDAYGNKASETDPAGNTTAYTYDANGDLLTQTLKGYTGDPNNPSTAKDLVESSRAYDPAGRLASITDAMGDTTAYTYTDNGLTATITRTDQAGQHPFVERSTTYDAAGNPVRQVTNNGATTVNQTVDAADRTTSTTADPSGVNRTTTLSYTPDDKVATSTVSDGSKITHVASTTYDAMGRVTSRSIQEDGVGHPTGWWPLSQTSGGTVTDASGTGNTAAATNVTWSGGAATFNGSTSQIATNGPVVDTSQSFTVSAWVNPATLSTGFQSAVSQDAGSASGFALQYSAANSKWAFSRPYQNTNGSTAARALSTTTPATGTWTHLVGVFNATDGSMTLYVNGSAQGTATDSSPFNATGPLVIGRDRHDSTAMDYFNGSIANVQIYPRVLSTAEISGLYNAGRSGGTTASTTKATTTWTLDQRGLPTSMTDPDGNTTNYVYDEAGHLAVTSGASVNVETGGGTPTLQHPITTVGYDTFGEQVETQDPNGNTTKTAYDAGGRKITQTLPGYTPPGSSTAITAAQSWAYDQTGNVTDVTDPLSNKTHYVYDQLGDVASVTDPAGGVTKNVYDTGGQLLSTTTPTGAQTQATYDHLGRRLTATVLDRYPTATTSTTTYSYTASATDPGGAFLASTTTQNGAVTAYGYDNVGETTQVTDPAGATTRTSYDLLGRKTAVTLADGTATLFTYDQLGDVLTTQQTDTDGTTVLAGVSATYDAAGRQLSATDARGNTTTFTNDATGLLTQEVQPVDATHSITTSFGYDAAGNRTRFTDGRSNSWIYTYNSWNKPESAVEPATATYTTAADRTSTIAYDADGRPTTQTAPGGVSVSLGYDDLGDVTSQSGTGADAATATRSFTYDGDGRMLTAATGAVGTTIPATSETFTYNDRGALLTASGSAGSSSFAYNGDGLPTSRTDAAGTTAYGYDTADRLSTITDAATGTQLTYGYDQLSQPTSIAYGSGGNTRTYGYDHLHRLTGDTLKTAAGTTIASIAYGYDKNGNETSKTTTGFSGASANTYTYDAANRLTSWNNGTTSTAYAYDASGNRIQAGANVYTYDARDELTSDGVNSYTYTARGTLATQTSGGTTITSTSDAYGQQITQGTASAGTRTYVTDALGRVTTATGAGGNSTFSYSGTGNAVASDGANTYSRGPDGSLIGIGTVGGTTATAVLAYTDQHDDVVANFTANGAALTGSTTYDPLGNVAATTGQAGRLGYQSGWTDQATGKVDMAARWYNPAVGQFQNKDTASLSPVPDSIAANPFAYVDANPLTRTDPSGHGWWGDLTSSVSDAWDTASSWASDAWDTASSWASDAWDTVSSWASDAWDSVSSWASNTWDSVSNWASSNYHRATSYLSDAYNWAKIKAERAAAAARRAAAWAAAKAKDAYDKLHEIGKYAGVAVTKAVRTTVTFVKNHAAAIASFAASAIVFAGCESAITLVSGGTLSVPGAMVCGAAAGAVGGLVSQGVECAKGQKGACSASAFGRSALVGGVGGLVGAGVGSSLGGLLARTALSDALPGVVGDAITGSVAGGVSGGASGAIAYGLTCAATSGGCSWSGLAGATEQATESGLVTGAFGAGRSKEDPVESAAPAGGGRAEEPPVEEAPAEEDSGGSCPIPAGAVAHSFVSATLVLMADGSSKPISHIKAGDKIADAVPGGDGKNQTHTVSKVILTRTDHDFVDLTIATTDTHGQPHGVGKITTTFHHPFYDITQAAFVDAKDLRPGDRLQQPGGHTATVLEIRRYHDTKITYDLTINGLHTYYAQAGNISVLVHNCGDKVWEPFREGVDHTDQGTLPADAGIPAGASLDPGEYHFVVRQDGSLRAMQNESMWDLNPDAGHTSLGDRRGVLMAGTFDVDADGSISRIDNFSGHYRPTDSPGSTPLRDVTRKAFQGHGWDFSDDAWDYYAGPPGG